MINVHDNYWIPGEGFKYLSNGVIFSEGIFLGTNDGISNWHDTNDEPPTPVEDDDATTEDYEAALQALGVSI